MVDEDVKKLSPKERMKRLKEIQEKDKKEIEEAENLIKQSVHDAEQEETEEIVRRIKKPEMREIKVEDLFNEKDDNKGGVEEKVKGVKVAEEERIKRDVSERINQYGLTRPEVYDKVRTLVEKAAEGAITPEERENLDFYKQQFQDVNPGYMKGEAKEVVEKTEELFKRLRSYH